MCERESRHTAAFHLGAALGDSRFQHGFAFSGERTDTATEMYRSVPRTETETLGASLERLLQELRRIRGLLRPVLVAPVGTTSARALVTPPIVRVVLFLVIIINQKRK